MWEFSGLGVGTGCFVKVLGRRVGGGYGTTIERWLARAETRGFKILEGSWWADNDKSICRTLTLLDLDTLESGRGMSVTVSNWDAMGVVEVLFAT